MEFPNQNMGLGTLNKHNMEIRDYIKILEAHLEGDKFNRVSNDAYQLRAVYRPLDEIGDIMQQYYDKGVRASYRTIIKGLKKRFDKDALLQEAKDKAMNDINTSLQKAVAEFEKTLASIQ